MDFSAKATTKDAACFRRRRSCTPPRSCSTLHDGTDVVNNGRKSATEHPVQGHHFDSGSRASDFVQRIDCKSVCTEIVEDPLVTTTYFQRFECRSTPGFFGHGADENSRRYLRRTKA
jgi:hypothetical protein